ncbi:MAG: hypothetical protein NDI90_11230 [Nitrospira sp. BO4]|jgi:hypothetical protein|nr:hypothetical protein [Nitrospira sp. BO4]
MSSWRSILKASFHPQYAQYPQNPAPISHFEDSEDFEDGNRAQRQSSVSPLPIVGSKMITYCQRCGGGYWLRLSQESAYQCGRCFPSEARVETLFIPGGAPLPNRVGSCESTPQPPLQPGWLVTYQDKAGNLCGGPEDREHGTVQECLWDAGRWLVCLADGERVPLSFIRAVGQTDLKGRLCAAWTVREHGYDGRKQEATL